MNAPSSPSINMPRGKIESLGQRLFRTRAMDELPRMITHERIYILPSRRGWVFVLSLLIMLIASINYNLSLGYALCFMYTGLFASTLIATYKNLAGIVVKRIATTEGVSGNTLCYPVTLFSHHRSRTGITIENPAGSVTADVEADADTVLLFQVPAIRRGLQPLGRITLCSHYPLGLWFTWVYLHVDNHALVFPNPEHLAPPLPSDNTDSDEGYKRAAFGEFSGLREYQAGDAIASIAWKTAAKGLGVQVREFSADHAAHTMLNWNQTRSLSDIELRASRIAAWLQMVKQTNNIVSLDLPNIRIAPGHGEQHYRESMKALALFDHDTF